MSPKFTNKRLAELSNETYMHNRQGELKYLFRLRRTWQYVYGGK